ncbi:MAG TPA: alpha/beta hydrolase, partial [Burkholderiaceae bacterium]|nr:alpha/beta hydrolase [Burkholderiaceae bacterium]
MKKFNVTAARLSVLASVMAALAACGGSDGSSGPVAEDARPQDTRNSFVAPTAALAAMDPATGGSAVPTDRWTGVLNGAGYQIEVPKTNWNGKLVMWAHGYAGTGNTLTVSPPIMRKYLLDNGYAWAASSYTKNYYDVRAGVEDTNALALNFTKIAAANGRTLVEPSKFFISGVSMGGHITAAAIEAETAATANNKVKYSGAVPLCGVVGDTALADYFGGYQLAAQALAGVPASKFPVTAAEWAVLAPVIRSALWATFPTVTNAQGDKLKTAVQQLSGGTRPFYNEGWADAGNQGNLWASIGGDGTFSGILNGNIVDTTQIVYKIDASAPGQTALDNFFNASILKISPTPDANRKRTDGLRWIPVINGEFSVPVVTLHTLGDLFVPFKMEQVYATRAKAKGNDRLLVQRAIRDVGHCAFTAAEAAEAFDAMVKWEAGGPKPAGDDVLTPAVIGDPKYGCTFTNNTPSLQDYTAPAVRAAHQAKYPSCS